MPGMDGLDATKAIRALERVSGGHVPIIALTAGAFNEEKKRCLAAGMDDFLTKPIEVEDLMEVLNRTCPPIGKAAGTIAKACTEVEPAQAGQAGQGEPGSWGQAHRTSR